MNNKITTFTLILILIGSKSICAKEECLDSPNKMYQIIEVKNKKANHRSIWLRRKSDNKNIVNICEKPASSIYWISWNKSNTAFVINIRLSTKISKLILYKMDKDGNFIKIENVKSADFVKYESAHNGDPENIESYIISYDPNTWLSDHVFKYWSELANDSERESDLIYDCKIDIENEIIHEEILGKKSAN